MSRWETTAHTPTRDKPLCQGEFFCRLLHDPADFRTRYLLRDSTGDLPCPQRTGAGEEQNALSLRDGHLLASGEHFLYPAQRSVCEIREHIVCTRPP